MKAQITIIAITAFLQASAVPFLNNRPSLLGSLQENVNNVVSQGQDIIDKGKEVISEHVEEIIDKGKEFEEAIENIEDLTPDQISELIEEFPLAIEGELLISPNDVIEEVKETIEGISDLSPEQVPVIIQDNFPDIPLTEEDVAHIVEELQDLQDGALEAINQNFNIQNTICSQIRNAIKKTAAVFIEQITKLIRSFQGKMVELIERGEILPSRTLDVIEKSANDAINGFERILKGLGVPSGIIENTIPVIRKTTEKNIEIARTYVSYLGGSKLGEIVEKIKVAIGNGLPSDVAIRDVLSNEIQAGLDKFEDLKIGATNQVTSRGFFSNVADRFSQLLDNARLQEKITEIREKYENNVRETQAKLYAAIMQVEGIGNELEGFRQKEIQDIIQSAVANIRENFKEALENVENVADVRSALRNPFADMEAEIGKIIASIINQIIEHIKNNIAGLMGNLEEIAVNAEESEWELQSEENEEVLAQESEGAGYYRPEGDRPSGAGGLPVPSFSGNPDFADPDRIFLTLI